MHATMYAALDQRLPFRQDNPPQVDRLTSSFIVSRCAALLCALIALANSVGWVFGLPALVSVLPSLPRCGPYYTVLAVAEDLAVRMATERAW